MNASTKALVKIVAPPHGFEKSVALAGRRTAPAVFAAEEKTQNSSALPLRAQVQPQTNSLYANANMRKTDMSIADLAHPAVAPPATQQTSQRRLVLRSFQSPGDVVMLTAAVRDLHLAYPAKFLTDVRTSAPALWEHNPYVTQLDEHDRQVESLDMHYPLIHESDRRPYHFIHGYVQYLERQLGVTIPLTRFAGDIHLSAEEKRRPSPLAALGQDGPFWIVIAGGKYDFTAKWWNPASYQAVVDHFQGQIQFVQCGEAGHFHPRLSGAIDLVGKTSLREFVLLMHHADGVLCPVTLAMHLAAAVETRPEKAPQRACVVVAGGREPAHWEQYPHHQFLSTVGMLPCCSKGACWRSRCQPVGDGDAKDRQQVCEQPVQVTPELRIPRCQEMITPADVIRRIEGFYEEAVLAYLPASTPHAIHIGNGQPGGAKEEPKSDAQRGGAAETDQTAQTGLAGQAGEAFAVAGAAAETLAGAVSETREEATNASPQETAPPAGETPEVSTPVLIDFRHGLGDAVQLTTVLLHLRHYHPDWRIDVAAGIGKHTCYFDPSLCHRALVRDRDRIDRSAYAHVYELNWDECPCCFPTSPSTKAEHCLRSVFKLAPIAELCRYQLNIREDAQAAARVYLESLCGPGTDRDGRYPAVLIHYQANTSAERKNLSHELIRDVCETLLALGFVPVILDWDRRSPLADGVKIHNPGVEASLWGGTGTGDAEALAALIEQASLFIGVDSGPLHVAGACSTPTVAVWSGHHPLHYFGLADQVTHFIPEQHVNMLRCNVKAGRLFFEERYRYRTYANLGQELPRLVRELLPGEDDEFVRQRDFWVRRDNVAQDLVIVQDIAEEDSYRIAELDVPGPVAVDVGAHIGVFSRAFRRRHPSARIVAVECCPENIPALERNVGDFASIVQAALTYEQDAALLNAVYPDCVSTGGSTVVPRRRLEAIIAERRGAPADSGSNSTPPDDAARQEGAAPTKLEEYWLDARPLATLSLEALMSEHALERIDVLKLDCEGSEFSILEHTTSLDRIGAIVGEFHGRERFLELIARRFADWKFRMIRDGDLGTFWLVNPRKPAISGNILQSATAGPAAQTSDVERFWTGFLEIVHPIDRPVPEVWRRYYGTLFELARELRPKRVCEIGVRAGYSAYAILSARPDARMLGVEIDRDERFYNTHGGRKGLCQHAETILAPFDFELLLANSHLVARLPRCDLVYVDGDHSLAGCLADLRLAEKSSDRILVDDYDSIATVREACQRFAAEHGDFTSRYIDNGMTGLLLFERKETV